MIPTTIENDIERGSSGGIGHRRLNNTLTLHFTSNGRNIYLPINPIVSKYKDIIDKYTDEVELTEDEVIRYRYSPKTYSEDMYGTIGYWSVILFINECHSIIDFHPETSIKFIQKDVIEDLFEEILALETI